MNYIFLVLILIIIVIISYITIIHLQEDFTYNKEIMVIIPTKEHILYKLSKSNYLNKLSKTDLEVRDLNNMTKQDILEIYKDNILEVTSKEKLELNNIIRNILDNLKIKDKKQFMFKEPWNIVKFKNLENNYPHTHDKFIFLPKNMISNINSRYNKITLVHELVHVFQRLNPTLFHMLYTNHWNFETKNIKNIKLIEDLARSNPDGLNNNWVFTYKNVNIVLISLYNEGATDISQVTKYGIYLNDDFQVKQPIHKEKLENIPEYMEFFGNIGANGYHPNEISAEMISMHIYDKLNSDVTNKSGYINFKKWWSSFN